MQLKARERIFNAIKLKPVDKVPMTYRGTELATLKMMNHFDKIMNLIDNKCTKLHS